MRFAFHRISLLWTHTICHTFINRYEYGKCICLCVCVCVAPIFLNKQQKHEVCVKILTHLLSLSLSFFLTLSFNLLHRSLPASSRTFRYFVSLSSPSPSISRLLLGFFCFIDERNGNNHLPDCF